MEYPLELAEDLLRQRIPARSYRLYKLIDRVILLGCLGLIVLAITPFALGLRLWAISVLPLGLAAILSPLILSRTKAYREAYRGSEAIHREYPDYWAILQPATIEEE